MFADRPLFSIVVPTYNRPDQLAACLQSIVGLDYSRDRYEVIVVDDGGEASLESLAGPFNEIFDLTLITQANAGPAAARNNGAVHAKGEYLVFTDDDCQPGPDWLETLSVRFAAVRDAAVGGRTLNALPGNPYSTASQMLIDYLYGYFNRDPDHSQFSASNNLALPANLFHELSGFDTAFPLAAGEDREFCDRWVSRGFRLIYAPEVVVYHTHELTLRSFWKQHLNYGRGALHFHRLRAKRDQRPVKIEPLKFYLDLLRYPLSQPCSQPRSLLVVLLVVSQLANAAGYYSERMKQVMSR